MISSLDHIAVAVENMDEAIRLWTGIFPFKLVHREIVKEQKSEIAMLQYEKFRLELIATTDDTSSVAKFLRTRGQGLHHIAFTSPNADIELMRLNEMNIQLIDEKARSGAEQTKIGFVHPKSLGGVLVEIVEHPGTKK
jgi:methylmalonyl-CoA/ethylmalonyl-CoA epimerase